MLVSVERNSQAQEIEYNHQTGPQIHHYDQLICTHEPIAKNYQMQSKQRNYSSIAIAHTFQAYDVHKHLSINDNSYTWTKIPKYKLKIVELNL